MDSLHVSNLTLYYPSSPKERQMALEAQCSDCSAQVEVILSWNETIEVLIGLAEALRRHIHGMEEPAVDESAPRRLLALGLTLPEILARFYPPPRSDAGKTFELTGDELGRALREIGLREVKDGPTPARWPTNDNRNR